MKTPKILSGILACAIFAGTMLYGANISDTSVYADSPREPQNPVTQDSMLFDKTATEMILCQCTSDDVEIIIPSAVDGLPVTTIGYFSIVGLGNLKSVEIPDSVTTIEEIAFVGCNALTSITIPDSVTSIGWNAFGYCEALTSVKLPANLKNIERDTFFGCGELKAIMIPDSVETIGEYAFGYYYEDPENYKFDYVKVEGFKLCGAKGSAAEKYAEENGFIFVDSGKLGNINDDDAVDSRDASAVLAEYANMSTGKDCSFSDEQAMYADVNLDGTIDAKDASKILSYYADLATGKNPSFA